MPKNQKEAKSCHDCGLEDINACENSKHRSSRPLEVPCRFCLRNPESIGSYDFYDFYDEQWTLNARRDPIIEDPTPHGVELLKTMRQIIVVRTF